MHTTAFDARRRSRAPRWRPVISVAATAALILVGSSASAQPGIGCIRAPPGCGAPPGAPTLAAPPVRPVPSPKKTLGEALRARDRRDPTMREAERSFERDGAEVLRDRMGAV